MRLHYQRCQRFCTQTAHSGFLVSNVTNVGEVEDCMLHPTWCSVILIVIAEDVGDGSNYIVLHNSNYSNKEIHRIIASNNSLFRIKT